MRTAALAALTLAAPAAAQCGVTKYTAANGQAEDSFGISVAVGGGRALVGAPFADAVASDSGAAYVYDTATGQQLFELTASNGGGNDFFGWSVAIEGDLGIVGATLANAAYVFDLTTGQELAKLMASDKQSGAQFGASLAARDGRLLVGAPFQDFRGAAYLFDLATGQELLKFSASDGESGDRFGTGAGLGATRVVVGANFDTENGLYSGSAYVFDLATGQELMKLVPADGEPYDHFGLNLAADGNRAVFGVPMRDGGGGVYVYDLLTGQELFFLTDPEGKKNERFGSGVALAGDRALIGADNDDDVAFNAGAAYTLEVDTGVLIAKLTAADGDVRDHFGYRVAFDGTDHLIGAWEDDDQGEDAGAAYFFPAFATVGASYCGPAANNSTGLPAVLAATGCAAVADDFLVLHATQLPAGKYGYFLVSEAQGFVQNPGGSSGNLCLAGDIGRYVKHVASTGPDGELLLQVDLAKLPTHPPRAVLPGETWNFQAWFRDNDPTPTSNFTDGAAVTFQ